MRALLDVNVLIALHDPQHVHHALAVDWLEANIAYGWASCPLTQNGCLRVMCQPSYPNPWAVHHLAPLLAASFSAPTHMFWPDAISLLEPGRLRLDSAIGPRQLTDLYLLALAAHHGGRFVTFDARVPVDAVVAAGPKSLHALLA